MALDKEANRSRGTAQATLVELTVSFGELARVLTRSSTVYWTCDEGYEFRRKLEPTQLTFPAATVLFPTRH
jgi:hypothetical protein